jgi:hypothetical protein
MWRPSLSFFLPVALSRLTSFMIFLGALWPRSRLAASFSRFGLVRLGVAALGFQYT